MTYDSNDVAISGINLTREELLLKINEWPCLPAIAEWRIVGFHLFDRRKREEGASVRLYGRSATLDTSLCSEVIERGVALSQSR